MKKLSLVLILTACGQNLSGVIDSGGAQIKPQPEPIEPVPCALGQCPRDLYDPWEAFPASLQIAYASPGNQNHTSLPAITALSIDQISTHVYQVELEINGVAEVYFTDNTSPLTEYRYLMRNASMTSPSGLMIKGFQWVSPTTAQVEVCRFLITFTSPTQCLTLSATYE